MPTPTADTRDDFLAVMLDDEQLRRGARPDHGRAVATVAHSVRPGTHHRGLRTRVNTECRGASAAGTVTTATHTLPAALAPEHARAIQRVGTRHDTGTSSHPAQITPHPKKRERRMEQPLDPYLEVGVSRAASKAEVTDAYHHLIRRYHPDSRPTPEHADASDTALVRIMAAYTILADPDRRQKYDRQHPELRPPTHHHPPAPPVWIGPRPPASVRITPVRWH